MKQLASDVGGTFVDIVLWDSARNTLHVDKLASTRHSADGIVAAITKATSDTGTDVVDIDRFVHGFTIATNAWLERRGARVLLLTSKGCRDVLEIGTQRRRSIYSLRQKRTMPLVPRSMVREVDERLDAFGGVVTPLTETEIARVVEEAVALRPEAIAIGLIYAYLDPTHEEKLAAALRQALPDVEVYLSSQINPQIEEYPRINTTTTAAYVGSAVHEYLTSLQTGLRRIKLSKLLLMRSDGGIATPEATLRNPGTMLLSGPAGGVIAAAAMGRAIGVGNIVTFDMGGTSADFSLITEGRVGHSNERVVDEQPIRLPMIDIETISAGGGSIASVDHAGRLSVGPHSAGSVPGPACYGRGGTRPTLTDACLVLGYIDPDDFAGGNIRLDSRASFEAIRAHVASPLGIAVEDAALGMVAVANAHMRQAIRALTIERGHDIRDFSLTAFGGAGSIFAALMAPDLGIAEVLIPPRPGVFAALGLLMSDIRHHNQMNFDMRLSDFDADRMADATRKLTDRLREALGRDGISTERQAIRFSADMRYTGQFHNLSIELSGNAAAGDLAAAFHRAHERILGHADTDAEIEIVALRGDATGQVEKASFAKVPKLASPPQAVGKRLARFPLSPEPSSCSVYRREALGPGAIVSGPAIIAQTDTTIVLQPRQQARVDDWGVLHITGVDH